MREKMISECIFIRGLIITLATHERDHVARQQMTLEMTFLGGTIITQGTCVIFAFRVHQYVAMQIIQMRSAVVTQMTSVGILSGMCSLMTKKCYVRGPFKVTHLARIKCSVFL